MKRTLLTWMLLATSALGAQTGTGGGGKGGGGGSAGVASYNGRTGAVVPTTGDYTASQVGADATGAAAAVLATSTQIPTFPVAPQCYFKFAGGSGSTWAATIGAYSLSTVSGSWVPWGRYYTQAGGQYDTNQGGCSNGAQTVVVVYLPDYGAEIVQSAAGTQYGTLLSYDASSAFIDAHPNMPGQGPALMSGGSVTLAQSVDRATGPIYATLTLGSGTGTVGLYGNPAVASWANSNSLGSIVDTASEYQGDYRTNPTYGFSGTIIAKAYFSTVLTAAQQQATYQKIAADLLPYGVVMGDTTDYNRGLLFVTGDSISSGYGADWAYGATSMNQALPLIGLDFPLINASHQGWQTNQLVNDFPNSMVPTLRRFGAGPRLFSNASGTNDVFANVASATIVTNLTSLFTLAHASAAKTIAHTLLPTTRNSGGQNTTAGTVNTAIVSGVLGGTLGGDTLSDWASEPTMGLLANASNSALYGDGLHPTVAGAAYLVAPDALALHRLTSPQVSYDFVVPITPLAFTGVAATTKTQTLVQLMPGEQVCGVRLDTTVAFTGTSLTALTASVGDSTGSTTQYLPAQSMIAVGGAMVQGQSYTSSKGIVQITFTSTGANLSAATGTSTAKMNATVCLRQIP